MKKLICKENYPEMLFWDDVDDVLNEIDPNINKILKIPKWDGAHETPHSYLSFGDQLWTLYANQPLIYQPVEGSVAEINMLKTKWKNKFILIAESEKARFILQQIGKLKRQSDGSDLLTSLGDFTHWADVLSTYNTSTATNSANSVLLNNSVSGNRLITGDLNNQYRTDSSSAAVLTSGGESLNSPYMLPNINAQVLTDSKINSDNFGINSSTNESKNAGQTSAVAASTTSSSNASKDFREYLNSDIRNFTDRYLNLFSRLFKWHYF